ncbi:hypothetical protein Taro_032813 [Colocasia esculenta]|uniref:Uncharacterized protein n=1 Tax=Colocasia esculenta TaxID=4460 RepID=A0A843VYB5_COLES|nr:hypothetical protein [Colocasia esculenta]
MSLSWLMMSSKEDVDPNALERDLESEEEEESRHDEDEFEEDDEDDAERTESEGFHLRKPRVCLPVHDRDCLPVHTGRPGNKDRLPNHASSATFPFFLTTRYMYRWRASIEQRMRRGLSYLDGSHVGIQEAEKAAARPGAARTTPARALMAPRLLPRARARPTPPAAPPCPTGIHPVSPRPSLPLPIGVNIHGRLSCVGVNHMTPTLSPASSDVDVNFSDLHALQSPEFLGAS